MDLDKLVPWIISGCSLLLMYLTFIKNGNKDIKKEQQEDDSKFDGIKEGLLKANMKLDQVCATTNETRSDIKCLNKDLTEMDRRVSIMERDLKTAFNIIDDLKGKVK